MFMSNSKRFNKLKHKSTYVNLEYEDVLDEFNTARLECVKAIKRFCEDMNRVSPIVEDNEMKEKLSYLNIDFLDQVNLICPNGVCLSVNDKGLPIYKDAWHMRPYFVKERMNILDFYILRSN